LPAYGSRIPLVAGTNANFAELNEAPPPLSLLDGICFAAHPQEHAFDNRTLVENLEGLAAVVESARALAAGRVLAITPVTLRRRVNPYATGPAPQPEPGELPPRVDVRQLSLFGAGWTLGSLKYLAANGVASLTYYETTGWLGVMETEEGAPLPDRFPSRAGTVFPLYHVLCDLAEFGPGAVLAGRSSAPLVLDGFAVRQDGITRALLANFTGRPQAVTVEGLGRRVRLRHLDETNAERAMAAPEAFREEAGEERPTAGGRLELVLRPCAVVRLDTD
jgi:hypothetical protein